MEETTRQERAYYAQQAAIEADERHNAEIANQILGIDQALALLEAMRKLPIAAVGLAEVVFEAYGWPCEDVDNNWLDTAGCYTMDIYAIWRAGEVK